tara:strand:- start:214 stop:360 length:147 start_codon:yes stop_codon:yes gene_type:complete
MEEGKATAIKRPIGFFSQSSYVGRHFIVNLVHRSPFEIIKNILNGELK